MKTRCRSVSVAFLVATALGLAACPTSSGNGGVGSAGCTVGASIPCACTDGRTGAQLCLAGGVLGTCVCTGGSSSSSGAAGGSSSSSGGSSSGSGASSSFGGGSTSSGSVSSSPSGSSSSGGPDCSGGDSLQVYFSPMYSANDGLHTFQIPASVVGVTPQEVAWYTSDPSLVSLMPDPQLQGVMITAWAPGTATITANVGDLCGSSLLTITDNTPDDWDAGYWRYNNNAGDAGSRGESPLSACTACHGTATSAPYQDVSATPAQAGGFSDDDLASIITEGSVPGWICDGGSGAAAGPDAGYFDTTLVPYCAFHGFHQYSMTPEQLTGVICYLRSLTPVPQAGSSNFGGHGGDGG